ncbi:unnamed protein product [Pieris macdunnoughi]|uniref:Uncharacterized protein n=1 Tax=Pieris macdunnoughi TaxID=345717 RepID=A0A821TCW4_9NEOP|nr:unnamed protein product [Pieris macdunnoughi]
MAGQCSLDRTLQKTDSDSKVSRPPTRHAPHIHIYKYNRVIIELLTTGTNSALALDNNHNKSDLKKNAEYNAQRDTSRSKRIKYVVNKLVPSEEEIILNEPPRSTNNTKMQKIQQ